MISPPSSDLFWFAFSSVCSARWPPPPRWWSAAPAGGGGRGWGEQGGRRCCSQWRPACPPDSALSSAERPSLGRCQWSRRQHCRTPALSLPWSGRSRTRRDSTPNSSLQKKKKLNFIIQKVPLQIFTQILTENARLKDGKWAGKGIDVATKGAQQIHGSQIEWLLWCCGGGGDRIGGESMLKESGVAWQKTALVVSCSIVLTAVRYSCQMPKKHPDDRREVSLVDCFCCCLLMMQRVCGVRWGVFSLLLFASLWATLRPKSNVSRCSREKISGVSGVGATHTHTVS